MIKKSKTKNFRKSNLSFFTIIICVVLIFYCVSLIIPSLWGLMSSFKDKWEFRNIFALPKKMHFENYSLVFKKFYMEVEGTGQYVSRKVFIPEMIYNSLIYSIGLSLVGTFMSAVMGYVTARYDYKFSYVVYTSIIVTMVLPIVGSLPSELNVARNLGLYDSPIGMIVMKTYFFGMYFLIFHHLFKDIPKDYAEAAQVDGASNFTIMFVIMFPFAFSTFFSIFILKFIGYWNDYQTPLLFMPNRPTLAYGLYHFANEFYDNDIKGVPQQLAACFMMAVPIFVLFLLMQKRLMNNISLGGIKG